MKQFEIRGADGRLYIHNERWNEWRDERLAEYPCAPGKYRFEIEIEKPRLLINDVPAERNPHARPYGRHYCFYHCNDWSTIFGTHSNGSFHKRRMIIESGNTDPVWGERITMYSTSSALENEPWGQNPANVFCYFWGGFWRVSQKTLLHEWHSAYPITRDQTFVYGRGQPGGMPGCIERAWPEDEFRIPESPVEFPLDFPPDENVYLEPEHPFIANWKFQPPTRIEVIVEPFGPQITDPEELNFNDLPPVTRHLMESWVKFDGLQR